MLTTTVRPADDVRAYLRGKGLDVRTSGKEVLVPCFFDCNEPANSQKKKLYIHGTEGVWQCWVCSASGSWKKILEHFGDSIEGTDYERPSRRLEINNEYVSACQEALLKNKRALTYLFSRGLTLETIEEARLGYHPKGVSLVESLPSALVQGGWTRAELVASGLLSNGGKDFHEGRLILPYLSSGQVLQVRGRALDPTDKIRYATPPGEEVRLYNSDDLRGADRVLLTEGEFDALMVRQVLQASPDPTARNIGVVAIPGVNSLPGGKEGFGEFFEDIRRVYVGLDNDAPGKGAAARIAGLLKTKSRIVEIKEVKDWGEMLASSGVGWRDVMGLITEADMHGKRVFSVAESALALSKQQEARPGLKTGWRSLDALIVPGLQPGQVTVPIAKTGTAKSLLLSNLAWNLRLIPSLYITLELTKEETVRRLYRIARFHDATYEDADIPQQYPLLGIADQNRLSPEDFNVLVEEFAEENGERPQIVYVDYLGYYARGQRGKDQYERVTNAIMQLKEMSKAHGVHTFVPSQVNRSVKDGDLVGLDAARDAGAVDETADFVMGLSMPHRAVTAGNAGRVTSELKLNLAKSRHGNTGRVVTLHFAPLSLAIVDDTDAANKIRVQTEVEAYNRGMKYEEWLSRRRQEAWRARQGTIGVA